MFETWNFLVLFLIVGALLTALFINDKRKMFFALAFDAIGYASLVVLFATYGWFWIDVGCVIMAAMVMLMLLCKRKSAAVMAWIVTLFVLLGALFSFNIFTVLINTLILCVIGVAFMIVATIIRVLRNRKEKRALKNIGKGGFMITANILATISYACGLLGIRSLFGRFNFIVRGEYGDYLFGIIGQHHYDFMILYFLIMVICGGIACLLYRRTIDYSPNPIEKALYYWTWLPAVIVIVICFIIAALGGEDNSESKVYKVRDEDGNEHVLSYRKGETSCTDENGYVWETDDGGKTFRKKVYKVNDELSGFERVLDYKKGDKSCTDNFGTVWETDDDGKTFHERDVRIIKHDDGTKTYLRDVSSGTKQLYEDKDGFDLYESDDGGKTVKKIENE